MRTLQNTKRDMAVQDPAENAGSLFTEKSRMEPSNRIHAAFVEVVHNPDGW